MTSCIPSHGEDYNYSSVQTHTETHYATDWLFDCMHLKVHY